MAKITFIDRSGAKTEVEAKDGKSLMEVALDAGVDIEAACEGSLACATCHLILDEKSFAKTKAATSEEEDMLDLAQGLTATSRLTCQVQVSDALDGATITMPDD